MAGIASANLAGSTITYNGVQFGGADAAYSSMPPQYSWASEFVYDEASRAVIYVRYTMTVSCVFYNTGEGALSASMDAMKERLSAPGKELKIEGIGTGFGTISNDLKYGPKPLGCEARPHGQLAWEVVWTVQFHVSECQSGNAPPLTWLAWNFAQTWTNDFEGFCTRRIAGYVEIAGRRGGAGGKQPVAIADQIRERINILVPFGFKRMVNNWDESADKTRLTFTVVDQQLTGDPYPAGVTLAQGRFGFSSQGPGFAKGTARLSMTLKTSPEVGKGLAGIIFLQSVMAKQAFMNDRLAASKGIAIPSSLEIENAKYDDARITNCSASWQLTKCLNAMLNATGIWEPLTPGNYQQWRASIESLWRNRGNADIAAIPGEDMIIDVCDGISSKTFGGAYSKPPNTNAVGQFSLTCPPIPPNGGWIAYDLDVYFRRTDEQTWHKPVAPYQQGPPVQSPGDTFSPGEGMQLGGPPYNQNPNDYETTEYQGYPEWLVLLQFKGLRAQHQPTVPNIRTIGGHPARLVKQEVPAAKLAFDIFECPAWFVRAWRLYRFSGAVQAVFPQGSKDSCARPNINDNY